MVAQRAEREALQLRAGQVKHEQAEQDKKQRQAEGKKQRRSLARLLN